MPLHAVQKDIAAENLVKLGIEDMAPEGLALPRSAIYRADNPPEPATRWQVEFIAGTCSVRLAFTANIDITERELGARIASKSDASRVVHDCRPR